jgi:hypothetical protein
MKFSQIIEELNAVVKQFEDLPKIPIAIAMSYPTAHRIKQSLKNSGVSLLPSIEVVPLMNFSAFIEGDGEMIEIMSYSMLCAVKKVDENFAQLEIKSPASLSMWLKAYEGEYLSRNEPLRAIE